MTTIPSKTDGFLDRQFCGFSVWEESDRTLADGFRPGGNYRVPDRRKSDVVDGSVIGKVWCRLNPLIQSSGFSFAFAFAFAGRRKLLEAPF
jgi:hypothetical protein